MRATDSFSACGITVRRHDPDRYFASLFAPVSARPYLHALYAFVYEIARVAESVCDPMLGEIRLEWWRETVLGAREGKPRAHDVARDLADVLSAVDLPQDLFDRMIAARRFDSSPDNFARLAQLEDYAADTSGTLMQLAARILGAGDRHDAQAKDAGIGYALIGILRAVPFQAARRKLFLPRDVLDAVDLSPEELFAGKGEAKMKAVTKLIVLRAQDHLEKARSLGKPGRALAALLPAALVPLYAKRLMRVDPFRHPTDIATHRKQWALLSAAMRGRI